MAPPTLRAIVAVTARYYGFRPAILVGPRRFGQLVRARHVGMHVAKSYGYSLPQIASAFGRLDHTTALHGVRKVGDSDALKVEAAALREACSPTIETKEKAA